MVAVDEEKEDSTVTAGRWWDGEGKEVEAKQRQTQARRRKDRKAGVEAVRLVGWRERQQPAPACCAVTMQD